MHWALTIQGPGNKQWILQTQLLLSSLLFCRENRNEDRLISTVGKTSTVGSYWRKWEHRRRGAGPALGTGSAAETTTSRDSQKRSWAVRKGMMRDETEHTQSIKTLVNHAHKLGSQHKWNPLKGFQAREQHDLIGDACCCYLNKFEAVILGRINPTLYILKYTDYELWL